VSAARNGSSNQNNYYNKDISGIEDVRDSKTSSGNGSKS